MKIKRFVLLITIMCFSLNATACGEALYEMTDEEEAVITLYAAKAVSKFNENQTVGIANARVKPGELDDEETQEETAQLEEEKQEPEIDPETGEPIVADDSLNQEEEDTTSDAGYSFTDAIDVAGVEFTCAEFDVSTEFKTDNYVLTQVSGKRYLILSIEAENTSGSDVDFSEYTDRTYSLALNGGEKTESQFTPLSNDLSNFDGILAAGDTKSFILVFLFNNSSVENITSLELYVTSDGTTRGTTI